MLFLLALVQDLGKLPFSVIHHILTSEYQTEQGNCFTCLHEGLSSLEVAGRFDLTDNPNSSQATQARHRQPKLVTGAFVQTIRGGKCEMFFTPGQTHSYVASNH